MTPEGAVVKAILDYLAVRRIYAWRNQTGATRIDDGKRFIRFGHVGSSDILGILDDGRFLAIEVKGPKGRASMAQLVFLAEIAKRGGLAFVAWGVEDVERELAKPRRTA